MDVNLNQVVALRLAHYIERIVVKETVPKKRGELARSVHVTSVAGGGARLGTNKIYARIRHWGGTIIPKRKKALYWAGARHPVRRVVQKGKPYFVEAVELAKARFPQDAKSIFPDLPEKILDKIAEKLKDIKDIEVSKK